MDKSDDSLKSDIEEELDRDQMLDDSQIDVSVPRRMGDAQRRGADLLRGAARRTRPAA